nr:tetratricopeptide repeat protein [Arthrospira sp. PLM2.Bin9]
MAEIHWKLGIALALREDWQPAAIELRKAIALDKDWLEPQRELGRVLVQLEAWDEAVEVLGGVAAQSPEDSQTRHLLGDALSKLEQWSEAAQAYQNAIALNPEFSWSHNNLGDALLKLERWNEAADAYQNAIALEPEFFWSHNNLGDALLQLERWDEAAQAYQNAIGLKDDFGWSHYNLGEALSKLQRWDEAIKAYKDAIEIKSDLPCIHEKLGDALRYQVPPNLEEISQAYEQAIQANPQDLQIYYRALEANPKDAKISLMLADAFRSQGQLDKAVTFYKSTLKIEPHNAEIHIKLGDILLIKGYKSESIKHYKTAIQIEPNLSDIRYKLDELTANNESVIYDQLDATQVLQQEQLYISAKKHLLNQEYHQAIADCAQIMGLHQSIANIFPILVEAYTKQEKIKEAEFCLKNSQYIRQLIAYQQVINNWGAIITGDSDNAQPKSVATNDNHINKIIIYTCVWGRPELTRIVLSYYADIKRELSGKINLELLAVGSEGDASRKLCQECGFDYLEYPNQPLSSKWEYGLNRCADYDPDGVIIVGSDDIISQNLIEFYDEKLKDNLVFCGIQDAYFFDVSKQHLVLWMGYGGKADFARVGETIGMGRCLSRTLLDKLEFSIWKGLDINSSLDGAMTQKLEQLGLQLLEYDNCLVAQIDDKQLKIGHCGFKMAEIGACAVDLKFSNNITTIERYIERDANALVSQNSPWEILDKYFPNNIVDQLKKLNIVPNSQPINPELEIITSKSDEKKKLEVSFTIGIEEGEKIFKQALTSFRKQEYDKAIERCSHLLSYYPMFKDVFPLLAEAYIKKGKAKEGQNFGQMIQDVRRLIALPVIKNVWGNILEDFPDRKVIANSHVDKFKINKIVIYTCVWKRPELTKVILSYYSMLKTELAGKIQLELLAVGSEGEHSRKLCQSCGFDYVEYQNQPLSDKWEYGINKCKDYHPDAVIIVGSDDLISRSLIEFYDQKLKEGLVFCGITDAYFFDLQKEDMIHWIGYNVQTDVVRLGETTGMGRCLSGMLLDRLNFSLWPNVNKNRGLDGAMTQILYQAGLELLDEDNSIITQVNDRYLKVGHFGYKLTNINAMALDIKFSENLTTFDRYGQRSSVTTQDNPWQIMSKHFPSSILEELKELKLSYKDVVVDTTKNISNQTFFKELEPSQSHLGVEVTKSFESKTPYPIEILPYCENSLFLFSGELGKYDVIHAAKAGLKDVVLNDINEDFLRNLQTKYLSEWKYIVSDAFDLIDMYSQENKSFDLVNCDPSSGLVSKLFHEYFPKLYKMARKYLVMPITGDYLETHNTLAEGKAIAELIEKKHKVDVEVTNLVQRSKNYQGYYWLVIKKIDFDISKHAGIYLDPGSG